MIEFDKVRDQPDRDFTSDPIDISDETNLAVSSPLTLTDDTIGLGTIDISANTNLAVSSPITLTGDTLGFDFSTNNTWTGTNNFTNELRVTGTDTGATADKWLRIFKSSTESAYFGDYLGFTGIINPQVNSGSIFFGVANDTATDLDAFILVGSTQAVIGGVTSISFNLGFFNQEALLEDNLLTFQNPTTTTGIDWATAGSLGLKVGSTIEARLTADNLTFEAGATDVGLNWGTSGQLGFFIGATTEMWLTADTLTFEQGGTDGSISWGTAGQLNFNNSSISIETVGKGLDIKEGTNARMGQANPDSYPYTVSTTAVTTNSRIFLQPVGDPILAGTKASIAYVTNIVNGTSFDIVMALSDGTGYASADEGYLINWVILEPA